MLAEERAEVGPRAGSGRGQGVVAQGITLQRPPVHVADASFSDGVLHWNVHMVLAGWHGHASFCIGRSPGQPGGEQAGTDHVPPVHVASTVQQTLTSLHGAAPLQGWPSIGSGRGQSAIFPLLDEALLDEALLAEVPGGPLVVEELCALVDEELCALVDELAPPLPPVEPALVELAVAPPLPSLPDATKDPPMHAVAPATQARLATPITSDRFMGFLRGREDLRGILTSRSRRARPPKAVQRRSVAGGPWGRQGRRGRNAAATLDARHMCAMIAVPNSEHFTSFAPSMRRAKS
jgi:hypothetical protein